MNAATVASIVLMLLGMSGMGCLLFVVTHHPMLMGDEYKVALWMAVQYAVAYALMSVTYTSVWRKHDVLYLLRLVGLPSLSRFRYSLKVGGIVGLLWSVNYVCAFVAGPYIPNAMQTVFAQLQMLMTYFVNVVLFKNPLRGVQHLAVGLFVGLSLGAGVFVGGPGLFSVQGLSTEATVVWCVVYLCNSLAAGLATNCVEALMEAVRDPDLRDQPASARQHLAHGRYNEMDVILAVNVVSGVWMIVFDVVPLFGVAWLRYGNDVWRRVFVDWSALGSGSGQLYVFLLSLSSWVYTTSSYYALVQLDALFVAVVIAVCNLAQVAVFNSASLVTDVYYSPATVSQWEVNVAATVLSIAYAVCPRLTVVDGRVRLLPDDANKNQRVRDSVIGSYYEAALDEGKAALTPAADDGGAKPEEAVAILQHA